VARRLPNGGKAGAPKSVASTPVQIVHGKSKGKGRNLRNLRKPSKACQACKVTTNRGRSGLPNTDFAAFWYCDDCWAQWDVSGGGKWPVPALRCKPVDAPRVGNSTAIETNEPKEGAQTDLRSCSPATIALTKDVPSALKAPINLPNEGQDVNLPNGVAPATQMNMLSAMAAPMEVRQDLETPKVTASASTAAMEGAVRSDTKHGEDAPKEPEERIQKEQASANASRALRIELPRPWQQLGQIKSLSPVTAEELEIDWLGGYWKLPEQPVGSDCLRDRIVSSARTSGTAPVSSSHLLEVYAVLGDAVQQLFGSTVPSPEELICQH